MSDLSILEVAESAKINFENTVKMNPHIGQHPIFIIAMEQLKTVVEMLEKQDEQDCKDESKESILEKAAKKAARTGNRSDLQEYLKLRRYLS